MRNKFNSLIIKVLCIFITIVSICIADQDVNDTPRNKRFEASLYSNLSSIGDNIYFQLDCGGGFKLHKHFMCAIYVNFQNRNNFLTTNEFLTLYGIVNYKKNEFRCGLTGGLYTYRFGEYRDILPCAGFDLLYAYNITNNLSIHIKERISYFTQSSSHVLVTSGLIGIGIVF